MRDRGVIVGGLAVFVAVFMLPLWFNAAGGTTPRRPTLQLPAGERTCVAPVNEMRASHMKLLTDWREDVVRRGERTFVAFDGRTYAKSLTGTCMRCHANRAEFCDRCHAYVGVKTVCWECHVERRPLDRAAR